jgi:uncharacterized protein
MAMLEAEIVKALSYGFKDRAPWWGADLQTLRNQIMQEEQPLEGTSCEIEFPMLDGSRDRLTGTLETPASQTKHPLVLIIHGLTGCQDSTYVRESARYHLARGRRVLRLNLRGAGSSRRTSTGFYFGGCVDDIRAVIVGIYENIERKGIFAIGYSLGGNILINSLAQDWARNYIVGAATVSAPIRPAEAALRLMAPRNLIYQYFLLRRMKQEVLSQYTHLSRDEETAIQNASTIFEFDDRFTAPRNGYRDADDYYAKTAGIQFVSELAVPTLFIHARNDPWVPVQPYTELHNRLPAGSQIMITRSGGHVGFHERGYTDARHDRAIDAFIDLLL